MFLLAASPTPGTSSAVPGAMACLSGSDFTRTGVIINTLSFAFRVAIVPNSITVAITPRT
jgi:hypothetical protein